MRKTVCTVGVLVAGAGLLTGGTAVAADSTGNDGINIGNGNNTSVLPVQLCGNNVAILGAVVPIASPQDTSCGSNAPIGDVPSAPPQGNKPPSHSPSTQQPPSQVGDATAPSDSASSGSSSSLPEAPSPVAVRGHHAVTG